MTDREDLLDLIMAMEAHGVEPDNLGDPVDWLMWQRAEAVRAQQEASVRLLKLGGWCRIVRDLSAEFGRDVSVGALPDLAAGEVRS